jgi:hypothetical protein
LLFLTGRCDQDSRMVRSVLVECIENNKTTITELYIGDFF